MAAPGPFDDAGESRFTRRSVLRAGAGLTFGLVVTAPGNPLRMATASATTQEQFAPNVWVNVAPDGTITILAPADEMGQGSMTALPVVFAEELDADWDDVSIEFSPSQDEPYGNPGYYGLLMTESSSAVSGYYDLLRRQGAQARRVLLDNVAARWGVAADELTTEPSVVVHASSGRRISYGEVASFAAIPAPMPDVHDADLKDPADFRLIGHDLPRRDIPAKVSGEAQYSIDVQLAGMVYGMVVRSPVPGAALLRVVDQAARAAPGVLDVVTLPYGIGVVSETYEAAIVAAAKLEIDWGPVDGEDFDSDAELEAHMEIARDQPPREVAPPAGAYEREYRTDFLYQAQMEPLNAVAQVNGNGQSVEIWAGTQAPTHLIHAVAGTLGIPIENVVLHRMFIGGGFGRRSDMDHDWALDAVLLSRAVGRPVKSIWTREHDVQFGRFKPISAHCLRCRVDDQGMIVSWKRRTVGENVMRRADPRLTAAVRDGTPEQHAAVSWGTGAEFGYDFRGDSESIRRRIPTRVSWMRGVSSAQQAFATESFLDEVALDQGVDPVEFRMQFLRSDRARLVLRAVADLASWGSPGGRALGVAYTPSFGTIMATVAEVTLDEQRGAIRLPNVWMAVDLGIAVQPRNVVGQIEGAVIYGASNALYERITIRHGHVEQSNFHDYAVARMADAPETHVKLIGTDRPPTGIGDRAVLGVAPAIANAFAALTGRRLRHMPFNRQRVREALATRS